MQERCSNRASACQPAGRSRRVNHVLGEENINIAAQSLGTEGELGYVVTDVSQKPSQTTLDALSHIEGTIRMRVIS